MPDDQAKIVDSRVEPEHGSQGKVLVVEDDHGLRKLIRKILARVGVSSPGVATGAEVLERSVHDSELLLLDYRLPDMSADQLLASLRERGEEIPFLVMTGQGDERVAVEMMKLGARDYLIKDTGFLELLPQVVQRNLRELDTERKLAATQEDLRASEERWRSLTANSPDRVTTIDSQLRVEFMNHAPSGLTVQDLTGASILDQVSVDDRSRVAGILERVLESGEPVTYETCINTENGTIYYETRAVARVENGQRVGLTLHTRNITDRKQADEQRRNLEGQLLHAQKLESLGILAGGIAHDFNNILTSVLGYADLVLTELTPGSSEHESVEGIIQAARRAAELSGQMLAYSGRGSFIVEAFDISLLVKEMQQLLGTSINKKTTIEYRLDPDLPAVRGDVTHVRQIILNLIINAAEAIGDSSGLITVATYSMKCDRQLLSSTYIDDDLPAGTYACLTVSDTGCGMDEATREKIFDPFYSTKFTGRGLGLAALLGIVRSHQGAVIVESTPNQGTTFQVLFPVTELTQPKQKEQKAAAIDLQGRGTILLVDDEALVRRTVRKMLERFGFELLEAANGREAVQVFREHTDEIVLVLLDKKMPVMGGEEAFDEISKLRSDVKVVLSSGYNEEDATACFGDRRPAGFIKKPYRMSELRECIRTVLKL
jgi:PAS domain S-box-containing protein